MKIVRVAMTSADAVAAGEWYREVLDVPVAVHGSAVEVTIGSTVLALSAGGAGEPGGHHLAVTIPSNRFAESKAWLVERLGLINGGLLTHDGMDEFALGGVWNSQSVYFDGPDGSILELIARHSLTNSTSGPFGTDGLLGVSEVGVAVEEVPAVARLLLDSAGMPPFGPGVPEFTPVGDQDGLLILVAPRRIWFPTDDRAASSGALDITVIGTAGSGKWALTPTCTVRLLRPAER